MVLKVREGAYNSLMFGPGSEIPDKEVTKVKKRIQKFGSVTED